MCEQSMGVCRSAIADCIPHLSPQGTLFHRVIPRFVCQGGDVTFAGRNKQAPLSIYDRLFEDESFEMRHSEPGNRACTAPRSLHQYITLSIGSTMRSATFRLDSLLSGFYSASSLALQSFALITSANISRSVQPRS